MDKQEYGGITPAEAIYEIIKEEDEDLEVYLSYMPDGIKTMVSLYDNGSLGNHHIGPFEPLFQVIIKAVGYNEGYDLSRRIDRVLNDVNDRTIHNIKVKAIHPTSGILPLGYYEEGFYKFSMNYRAYMLDYNL